MEDSPPTVPQWVTEILQNLDEAELPADDDLRVRVDKLVSQGCNRRFVIEVSFFYAYVAFGFKRNTEAERSTNSGSRLVAFPGLQMTRRKLAKHVGDLRELARQMKRILAVVRKPGKPPETSMEAAKLRSLPQLVEQYCDFIDDAGELCYIPREKRLQLDRLLCSLVKHVKDATGRPNWDTLLRLINCWGLVFIDDDVTLRAQVRRADRPDRLPLFGP